MSGEDQSSDTTLSKECILRVGKTFVSPREFEWELCRENIKPLRGGRKVNAVNQALANSACTSRAEVLAKEKFNEMLEESKSSDDPLKNCLQFCTWFDQTFPIGRQNLYYQLLWKMVNEYSKVEKYLNDARMLKIWEKLADNSRGHGWEIYQHANSIGSLIRCAHIYVRWSQELEMRGAIGEARNVLRRGRQAGAHPIDLLNTEEDELDMREMRRLMDSQKNDSWQDYDQDEDTEERVAFTRLMGMGDGKIAPVIRIPSVVGEEGSSRIESDLKNMALNTKNRSEFEVLVDGSETPDNYLETIYDMDNHIERLTIGELDPEKWKTNKVPQKKIATVMSTFTVWEDDKENVDPQDGKVPKKTVLKLKKCLIRDKSIEENLAESYELLNIQRETSRIARRIDFDND